MTSETNPDRTKAVWPTWARPCTAGVLSIVLVAAFYLLRFTPAKMGAGEIIVHSAVTPEEFNFWMGLTFLVTPAAALAIYALQAPVTSLLRAVHQALERASARELRLSFGLFVALFAVLVFVGRDALLDGISVVDDEEAVRFGGGILASGHLFVDDAAGLLRNTFEQYLYWQGTHVASFDFLGIQVAHAVAELTGLGSWFFAVFASLAFVGVAIAASERLGRRGALVAVVLLAFSPMFVALSLTQQAHLVSRTFIALSFGALALVLGGGGVVAGAALGLCLGCAFVTRPPETTTLMAPLVVCLLVKAARAQVQRRTVAAAAIAAVPPLIAMLLHNHALTGSAFRFARMDLVHACVIHAKPGDLFVRFGNQIGHDAMLLMIFSFGAIGVVLVAFGTFYDSFTLAAAAGIACEFAMGLLHTDYGVHIVGPIHQSECVIPLCLLATHGLFRVREAIRADSLLRVAAFAGGTVCLAGVVFLTVHLREMHDITRAHYQVSEFLRDQTRPTDASKVVVIAPSYLRVLGTIPELRRPGSWVNGWLRPRPDLSDDLIVLTVEPDPSPLTLSRIDIPMSPEAARANPIDVPSGVYEWPDKKWLAKQESALAGRIRARFPERRMFKLMMDPDAKVVPIP